MSYTNAPATKMLATRCACCGKQLLDSDSVESGVGPECKKKHALPDTLDAATQKKANKLVYVIAMDQFGPDVDKAIRELEKLGCDKIVARIKNRVYGKKRVTVSLYGEDNDRFAVESPWSEDFVYRVRKIYGRKWDGAAKVNHFPCSKWADVWELIADCYNGKLMVSPKGEQVVNGETLSAKAVGLPVVESKPEEVKEVSVKIERHEKWFAIWTPYDRDLVAEMRSVRGRRWNASLKANIFPAETENDVSEIVSRYFPTATFTTEKVV